MIEMLCLINSFLFRFPISQLQRKQAASTHRSDHLHQPISVRCLVKVLTLLLFIVTATMLNAQTKQIAHRSHSGSAETFSLAANSSNLGISPEYYRLEPDTIQVIDSTEIPPRATTPPAAPVVPAKPATPAEPEPVKPETTTPEAAPATKEEQPEPSISKENVVAPTSSPAQAYRSESSKSGRNSSLFWLAFGLFLPAIVIGAVSIRVKSTS